MTAVTSVGIVGAGASGLALATLLARAGVSVEILEQTNSPSTLGSGITMQGNGLRILRDLGVWDDLKTKGYTFNELGMRAPDPEATVLAVIPDVRTGGPDLPATLGIPRPELAELVRAKAVDAGARIRYGMTVDSIAQDGETVTVGTASGGSFTYDILVGADGVNSFVRSAIGIDTTPKLLGMGAWRAFVPRPREVERTDLIYGGPAYIAGYCPTGENTMYAYLIEPAQDRSTTDGHRVMSKLAEQYGGPWPEIGATITSDTPINYTQFSTHLIEDSWHRDRVILMGDAVHNCPPTIAQGASMALEDAAVLADEILSAGSVDEALAQRYFNRRIERVRTVVEGSVQLSLWVKENSQEADIPGLVHHVAQTVTDPVT